MRDACNDRGSMRGVWEISESQFCCNLRTALKILRYFLRREYIENGSHFATKSLGGKGENQRGRGGQEGEREREISQLPS